LLTLISPELFVSRAPRSLAFAFALAAATTAKAQQAPANPESAALRSCVAHAQQRNVDSALVIGKRAETLFRQRIAANARDTEALVGLARVLSQCFLPSASFMTQGQLSSDAMELLDNAIDVDPNHWLARFTLASIAYRSPAFLGRGKRAAQELDYLLRLQGDSNDDPMFARVFEMRGKQLERDGQADSARALWTLGATLFPNDSALQALAGKGGTEQPPNAASPPQATSTLAAVRVTARPAAPPATLPSVREIPRSQVLMAAGGTADVMQAVQLLPGATRVGEGSDIYTRGGDAAETQLVLNGGRMLSLSRFEGLNGGMFGALEPFVVRSVRYSSGGFSARYGNALSGVIDIETDGRPRERATRAGLSLVQAAGTFRLPFNKRVGGWINMRLSHTGALLAAHGRGDEFDGSPHSQEVVASLIANPSVTSEIRVTALAETDDSRRIIDAAGWRGPFHSSGATRAAIVSSRWVLPAVPVLLRGTVSASDRSSDMSFGVLARERDEKSVVSRLDMDWQAAVPLTIRSGVELGAYGRDDNGSVPTSPSVGPGAPARSLGGATSTDHLGGYAEAELTKGHLTLTLGARGDQLPGEDAVTADPRAAISYQRGLWTTRLSAGLFHQGRWRPDAALPNEGDPDGVPTRARHLVAGIERNSVTSTLRVEAFAKNYDAYVHRTAGPDVRSGSARGIDVLMQRNDVSWLSGWIAYSLIDAGLTLPDGTEARSPFDVTHTATASVTARVSNDWSVGYSMRYGTGAPVTPIVGRTPDAQPRYGAPMSERLPAYARMDARVMRFIRMPQFLLTTFVEAINLTDRANVSAMTYDATFSRRRPIETFFATRTFVVGGELQLH
jgi:hypothetical protein